MAGSRDIGDVVQRHDLSPVLLWWLRRWPAIPRVRAWLPCSGLLACPGVHRPDWLGVVTPHALRHLCASQLPGRPEGNTFAVTPRGHEQWPDMYLPQWRPVRS